MSDFDLHKALGEHRAAVECVAALEPALHEAVRRIRGTFAAGPDQGGGFSLCARLPLHLPPELAAAS